MHLTLLPVNKQHLHLLKIYKALIKVVKICNVPCRFLGLWQTGAVLWFRRWRVWDLVVVRKLMNSDLRFLAVSGRTPSLFSEPDGEPKGDEQLLETFWSGPAAAGKSVSVIILLIGLWMLFASQHGDCLMEAVAGAQDQFWMHIFTYSSVHLSLNTLNVYAEVVWCLSPTTPQVKLP